MLGQVLGSPAFAKRLGQRELRFNKRRFFWRQFEEISSGAEAPALCFQSMPVPCFLLRRYMLGATADDTLVREVATAVASVQFEQNR